LSSSTIINYHTASASSTNLIIASKSQMLFKSNDLNDELSSVIGSTDGTVTKTSGPIIDVFICLYDQAI
jgi:hypothetical protein